MSYEYPKMNYGYPKPNINKNIHAYRIKYKTAFQNSAWLSLFPKMYKDILK